MTMTDSEFHKKYPEKKYVFKYDLSKERGHKDSITETPVEIIDKKTNQTVARVKKTEVDEPGGQTTVFWE